MPRAPRTSKSRPPAAASAPSSQAGPRNGNGATPVKASAPPPKDRQHRIAQAAYFLAEREGFPAGRELEHWLQAEAAIETQTARLAQ